MSAMEIGVLALQGDFREHRAMLERLGMVVREVRLPHHLHGLAGVVIPGGESTTMMKLMKAYELDIALEDFRRQGGALWGTCAGAIVIASEISGFPKQSRLAFLDVTVARNDYGRQVASFEAELAIEVLGDPFHAVFIRAPRITEIGDTVTVLGCLAGDPVMVRQEKLLATVFHPELTGDDRIHRYFLEEICTA